MKLWFRAIFRVLVIVPVQSAVEITMMQLRSWRRGR